MKTKLGHLPQFSFTKSSSSLKLLHAIEVGVAVISILYIFAWLNEVKSFFVEVLQIKEKIKKHRGIPISKQHFVLNGKILHVIPCSDVTDQSQIELIIDNSIESAKEFPPPSKIPILLRMSSSKLIATEIDVNDTIKKLKEEIHEMEGVPPTQLIFHANGIELNDQKSIRGCNSANNSEVIVSVGAIPVMPPRLPAGGSNDSGNHRIAAAEEFPPPQKVKILVKMPLPKDVAVEIDANDTIKKLKEKLYQMEGVHPIRLILHANGIELNDLKSIRDCELSDNSKVLVSIRAVPITPPPPEFSSAKLRVVVQCDGKGIAVEVNSLDTVGDLKNKLKNMELDLPQNYFFIHNHAVMYDDRSLRWHSVTHGDTLDIFTGYIA